MTTQAFADFKEALGVLDKTFINMSSFNLKHDLALSFVKEFEEVQNQMIYALIELDGITTGDTKVIFSEIRNRTKKSSSELRKVKKDKFASNEDLVKIAKGLYNFATVKAKELKDELEYKSFVKSGKIPDVEMNVLEEIFKRIQSNRDILVLEEHVDVGERLLKLEEVANAPKIFTFGADTNVEASQKAKDSGVYKIAKGGIHRMTPNCFDVFLFFQKRFTFKETGSYYTEPEVEEFSEFFKKRKPMKSGGYILFNLPYYRIPNFYRRLMGFKIEAMYRADDDAGNIIFVCSHKKPDELLQRKELKKALMLPESVPHYTEVTDIVISKGDVTNPEEVTFKGVIVDARDHDLAFKDEVNPMEFIESLFEPTEKSIELNEPLQEYKNGHLSAIAPTGITNGIYDTHVHKDMIDEDFMYPHILSTKILRRDVITMVEEIKTVKGQKKPKVVPVISIKKSSELTMTTRTPDGKVTYLLSKVKEEQKERAKEKKKETRTKAKAAKKA